MPDFGITGTGLIALFSVIFGPPLVLTFLAGALASVLVAKKTVGWNLLASTLAGIVGSMACLGSFAWIINRYWDEPQEVSTPEIVLPQVAVGALFGVFTFVGIYCAVKLKER